MARIYFIVADTTKNRNDIEQMNFFCSYALNDLSGFLTNVAKHNNTKIEDLRLYIAPNKKTWDSMREDSNKNIISGHLASAFL